jgi:hypothetical protein
MRKLIKHKLTQSVVALAGILTLMALQSGVAFAAAPVCYTYDSTKYTQLKDCSLLQNNDPQLKPQANKCYAGRQIPSGWSVSEVSCAAAKTANGNPANTDLSCTNKINGCSETSTQSQNANPIDSQPQATEDPALEYSSSQGASTLVKDYLNPLIVLLSVIFGILVVVGVILGGIQYSTSAGDPQKAAAAKGRIMKVLIALVAYLFLYAFLKFIIPQSWGVI